MLEGILGNNENMVVGTTSSGFNYKIDRSILGDWRLVKLYAELQRLSDVDEDGEETLKFIGIMADIEALMFKDKGKAFEKHILKNNDGIVAPVVALQELMEILKSSKQSKNS